MLWTAPWTALAIILQQAELSKNVSQMSPFNKQFSDL